MSPRIFVVDDMRAFAIVVEELLKENGFVNLRIFINPSDVITAVHEGDIPSLVITDFQMPGMDGVRLLNTLIAMISTVSGIIVSSDTHAAFERSRDFPVLDKAHPEFSNQLVDSVKSSLLLFPVVR